MQNTPIATPQVEHVMDLAPDSDMQRGGRIDPESKGEEFKCFITGAVVFSAMSGIRTTTFDYPCLSAAIARYVAQFDPAYSFTSLALFKNL